MPNGHIHAPNGTAFNANLTIAKMQQHRK